MIIKGGTLVMEQGLTEADLLICGEKITGMVASAQPGPEDEVMDAEGCCILPGVVDGHTHFALRSDSSLTADDFCQGTRAAACGGVTTIIDHASQRPGDSLVECVQARQLEAEAGLHIDYSLHCKVIDLSEGRDKELLRLVEMGISSFKVSTTYRKEGFYSDDLAIYLLLQRAREAGFLVCMHAENNALLEGSWAALVQAGQKGPRYHGQSRPSLAEQEAVNRGIFLAQRADSALYLVHLSTSMAVDLVARARAEGIPVIAESCPHYLILDDSRYAEEEHPEEFIMSPPLRPVEEREGLLRHLAEGRIDVIGTDHCGYTRDQKRQATSFLDAPQGIPGVETSLPLLYTYGVDQGLISLKRLAQVLSTNPARLFGLYPRKGSLWVGADADVVIYDPRGEYQLKDEELHGAPGAYTPFAGLTVRGRVKATLSRGAVIYKDGQFLGKPDHGRFVPRRPFTPEVVFAL